MLGFGAFGDGVLVLAFQMLLCLFCSLFIAFLSILKYEKRWTEGIVKKEDSA